MDDLNELRKEIAYRHWQLTGCEDKDLNWRTAGKILTHFLLKRTEGVWWQKDSEDYSLYRDIIYGGENATPRNPRPDSRFS